MPVCSLPVCSLCVGGCRCVPCGCVPCGCVGGCSLPVCSLRVCWRVSVGAASTSARCCCCLGLGSAGRPNQLSSAHRQGPGVDTATAGGPRPPPSHHCLSQAGVHPSVHTYSPSLLRSQITHLSTSDRKRLLFNVTAQCEEGKSRSNTVR